MTDTSYVEATINNQYGTFKAWFNDEATISIRYEVCTIRGVEYTFSATFTYEDGKVVEQKNSSGWRNRSSVYMSRKASEDWNKPLGKGVMDLAINQTMVSIAFYLTQHPNTLYLAGVKNRERAVAKLMGELAALQNQVAEKESEILTAQQQLEEFDTQLAKHQG